jgi:hypothetical protein
MAALLSKRKPNTMDEILEQRFVASPAHPISMSKPNDEIPANCHPKTEDLRFEIDKASFLKLLTDLERRSGTEGQSHIVATYQAWIRRNGDASTMLFAAWFNLGVALAEAADAAGAVEAYHKSLALRPGFHPAATNLAALLRSTRQIESALGIRQRAPHTGEAPNASAEQNRAEAGRTEQQKALDVLHVGCGIYGREKLPPVFRHAGWREIRLDIDPEVGPDFVASITDMSVIPDDFVDAVYSSHNIEHLYPEEVPLALQEMRRVLHSVGLALITLPDLQEVCRHVAEGKLEDPLYMSTMGPIAPLDILYGHRPSLASGNAFMAHHTGFTGGTLAAALIKAGFAAAMVQRNSFAFSLTAIAFRRRPGKEELARAQAQMLPAADCPALLYTSAS